MVALNSAPAAYGLVPPSNTHVQDQAQWIKITAAELLKDSFFLHGGLDDNVSVLPLLLS